MYVALWTAYVDGKRIQISQEILSKCFQKIQFFPYYQAMHHYVFLYVWIIHFSTQKAMFSIEQPILR